MKKIILSLVAFSATLVASAQYTTPHHHVIIDENYYDHIVGESSGESALRFIYDIAPYEKNRTSKEYNSRIFEIQYVADKMKELGFDNVKIDTYDKELTIWDGVSGSLWEVKPNLTKIADYNDMTTLLAPGSNNADVTAELVWVGRGSKEEMERADVAGKIVVTEGSMMLGAKVAKECGAVGVVAISEPRSLEHPLQIHNSGISRGSDYSENLFGFFVNSREGKELRNRLLRGEKIEVKADVKVANESFNVEAPWVTIDGTDNTKESVTLFAHLIEGYTKLGANDNASGSAALMEVARMLKTLIDRGDLPRPKRSIHFVWGDEFTASIPWANKNKEITDNALCNINLDMVGVNLADNNSFYTLSRTTFANPHYINDVSENLYRYMCESGLFGSDSKHDNMKKVVAPSGSDDPFLYLIESFTGGSDHQVFNDWNVGVPSVLMITWPDNNYHTSGDRPSEIDPTQMKRAIVIAATAAYTVANADEKEALRIASEVGALGATRLGYYRGKVISEIADSLANGAEVNRILNRAISDINAVVQHEKNTLLSVQELAPESEKLSNFIAAQSKSVENNEIEMIKAATDYAATFGAVDTKALKPSKELLAYDKIYPRATSKVFEMEYGTIRTLESGMSKEEKEMIKDFSAGEVAGLGANGLNSIWDIKKMSDFQTGKDCDINNIMKFFEYLVANDFVVLENRK
ncbi:MAG: M28 family peptidase [Rikenellaceae bacterium]